MSSKAPYRHRIYSMDSVLKHACCSDAAALLLASDLLDPSDILAVTINYPSAYSALAASSILGNYKRSHVPIGLKRPISWDAYFDAYFDDMGFEKNGLPLEKRFIFALGGEQHQHVGSR